MGTAFSETLRCDTYLKCYSDWLFTSPGAAEAACSVASTTSRETTRAPAPLGAIVPCLQRQLATAALRVHRQSRAENPLLHRGKSCLYQLAEGPASTHRETGGAVGRRAKSDGRSWKLPAVPGRGLGRDGGETVALRHERLLHVHVRPRAAGEARVGVPRQDDSRLTVVVAEAKYHSQLSTTDEQVCSHVYNFIGNESVPIQLAQCWFPAVSYTHLTLPTKRIV